MSESCLFFFTSFDDGGVGTVDGVCELLTETGWLVATRLCCGMRFADSITLVLKFFSCCCKYDIIAVDEARTLRVSE